MIKEINSKLKSTIRKEEFVVLLLSAICAAFILSTTNTLNSEQLAKVDFVSSENFRNWLPGWSTDNFGKGIGLGSSVVYLLKAFSFLPVFPFASLSYSLLIPIILTGATLFNRIKLFFEGKDECTPSLIAAYSVFFLTNSITFAGVFLYGWNLLTLIPLSGLALACMGLEKYSRAQTSKNLLFVAVGSFLIGGMIHFLIFPILYSLGKQIRFKNLLKIYATIILAASNVLLPEIFLNILGGQAYYQGIDPVKQSEDIQKNLSILDRFTGTFDPIVQASWFEPIWLLVFILGLFGLVSLLQRNVIHAGFVIALTFFFLLNFSGLLWAFSLNRLWTNLPIIGGIFRNPDKIFIFLSIGLFICASYYLSSRRFIRYVLLVGLIISTLNFYSSSNIQVRSQVAGMSVPSSYTSLEEKLSQENVSIRALLLPFPKWFHHYGWTNDIQTQNILRRELSVAVVSDEMETLDNIDPIFHSAIKSLYGLNCIDAKNAARELGITHIVVQRDILNRAFEIEPLERNLQKCFHDYYFESRELLVLKTGEVEGVVAISSNLHSVNHRRGVEKFLFGYRICHVETKDSSLLLREKVSKYSYLLFDSNMKRVSSIETSFGWRKWNLQGQGCYQLINLNSIVTTLSLFISISTIIFLWVLCLDRKRLKIKNRMN
jgi:hypothetical protein